MWRLSSLKIRVYTASRRSSDTQLIYWQNRNLLSLSVFECCSDVDISQGNNLRSIFIMRLADSLYIPTSATSFLHLQISFPEFLRSKWQCFLQILHVLSILNDFCLDYVWRHSLSIWYPGCIHWQMLHSIKLEIYLTSIAQQWKHVSKFTYLLNHFFCKIFITMIVY